MTDVAVEMVELLRGIQTELRGLREEQKGTNTRLDRMEASTNDRLDRLEVHARATNESVAATNTRLDRMDSRLIGVEEAAMSTNAVLRNVEKGLATLHEDMLSQGAKLATIGGELAGLRQEAAKDLSGLHAKYVQLDERVTKLESGARPPTRSRRSPRR
jgi:chromosome segregation ATPase